MEGLATASGFRHVAVCGVSYCGSTLLARILGSLPGVANIGESHWLGERRENGVKVPARPDVEDFALQVRCSLCGRNCRVLDREFRIALLADRRDWYQKIAARLGTSILVSADKNFRKLETLDPELRLDALVLFKDPLHAASSHFYHRQRRGSAAPTERDLADYLEHWARSYERFLDRFPAKGRKVVVSWERLSADPERVLPRLCSALELPWNPSVLWEIAPEQHCIGGNGRVHRHFRETPSYRFEPPHAISLAPELLGVLERHRARKVHRRLKESHARLEAGSSIERLVAPSLPSPPPQGATATVGEVVRPERNVVRPRSESTRRRLLDGTADQQAKLELWRRELSRRSVGASGYHEARLRFVEHVCDTFDHEKYRQLQHSLVAAESHGARRGLLKYFDLGHWLRLRLDLALELGLHEARPMTILDLGVGAGHFPFVCRYFGHRAIGIDVDRSRGGTRLNLYDTLLELFEVERVFLRIEQRRELPELGQRFDLVTALMVKFDNPRAGICWTGDDWLFLLRDLSTRHTSAGGRIFLSLNRPFSTPEVLRAFRDRGAVVDERRCTVRFDSLAGLRES